MITITPPSPTTSNPVTISVEWGGCIIDNDIVQTGSMFDIHFNYDSTCFATPPGGTWDFPVGYLKTGTYTVINRRLIMGSPSSQEATSFSVAAGEQAVVAVPTLEIYGVVVLMVLLALLSLFHLSSLDTKPKG
jgi:hypothetical protein